MDFIIGSMDMAIEAKASKRISLQDLKGLKELKKEYPSLKKRCVVCMEPQAQVIMESQTAFKRGKTDGIEVLPYSLFTKKLWSGELL